MSYAESASAAMADYSACFKSVGGILRCGGGQSPATTSSSGEGGHTISSGSGGSGASASGSGSCGASGCSFSGTISWRDEYEQAVY